MLLETERLRLRPLTIDDVDEFVALHAEPEVSRFMPAAGREQAIERLQACEHEWKTRGHGLLAILDRDRGRFLGRTGLRYWPQFDETEVGWALRPDAWGYGYATEAARACIGWGFRQLGLRYLTAMIRPDNARSIKVAERLGMARLRDDVLRDIPVVVRSVRRENWPVKGGRW